MAVEVKQKFSLCPECGACPEVEVLYHEGRPVAVRIGERNEKKREDHPSQRGVEHPPVVCEEGDFRRAITACGEPPFQVVLPLFHKEASDD